MEEKTLLSKAEKKVLSQKGQSGGIDSKLDGLSRMLMSCTTRVFDVKGLSKPQP